MTQTEMSSMPKIVHYREKCIGCNSCVEHAPYQWTISEKDGKSNLVGSVKKKDVHILPIEEHDRKQNDLAARDCPTRIIKILE